MTYKQITDIIAKNLGKDLDSVHSTLINISPINKQIDDITIIFKPDATPNKAAIGTIIEDLDNLTMDDEYGDMVELNLKIDRYHALGDDLTEAWIFTVEIDS